MHEPLTTIDPTARIASGAVIGAGAMIGPNCIVGPDVTLGEGCRLIANVHITGHTAIGPRTVIYPFASLGTPPQSVHYHGEPTRLAIGADCDIREGVTVNTGTAADRGVTEIGDHCFLMANSHVAHDCKVGNHVTFANNAVLGGHATVGDYTFLGGQAAVRQFVRIGDGVMVVGLSGVRADVIPWGMVQGPLANLVGLNVVGLRRRGHAKADIHRLRQAYRELFYGAGVFRDRLARVAETTTGVALVDDVIAFIRSGKRPLTTAISRASTTADDET